MKKKLEDTNHLFPIFLKQTVGQILLVGAGPVGLEKLTTLIQNMPEAYITVVAKDILPEIWEFVNKFKNIKIEQRPYSPTDLVGKYMVIAAVNNRTLSEEIVQESKKYGALVNVADTPDLCDFYLASIVQKGNLKIAISTNGKSPTTAKRLKETLKECLPDELEAILENLHVIRNTLKGDFTEKVKQLNEITNILAKGN